MIKQALSILSLPKDAQEFLEILWDCIQKIDDIFDGSPVEKPESILLDLLIRLPLNTFWDSQKPLFIPLISNAILCWNASNSKESEGLADEKSFVWRASYWQIVLQVCQVVHGYDWAGKNAHHILGMYGETFRSYRKEFPISNQLIFNFQ
jgi:hypothetical protein